MEKIKMTKTWKDYALEQIINDCMTTTAQLDDDIIYTDD